MSKKHGQAVPAFTAKNNKQSCTRQLALIKHLHKDNCINTANWKRGRWGECWDGGLLERKKNRSHRATVQAPVKTASTERGEERKDRASEGARNSQQMREALVSIPAR